MSDAAAADTGATTDTTTDVDADTSTDMVDWKAEAEKWKGLSRKHETELKKTSKELDGFRQASMTEQEKAVADALEQGRNEGRTEVRTGIGARLVDAEVKAAAAGRAVDVDALLEGLDRGRFLDDDGEPKVKDIVAWVDRIAPAGETRRPAPVDLGQGARGNGTNAIALNDPLLKDLVAKVGEPRK